MHEKNNNNSNNKNNNTGTPKAQPHTDYNVKKITKTVMYFDKFIF